jgi:hypothetical protein
MQMFNSFPQTKEVTEKFCRVRFLKPTNGIDYFKRESIPVEPGDCMDVSESDAAMLRPAGFVVVLTKPELPAK